MTEHIKVYGVTPRIQYVANGTSNAFTFPFVIFATSDIDVYLNDEKQNTNTYTVTGERSSQGGTVTFATAPTSGTTITIVRNLSIERTSDFQEGGALRADTLNDELDYQIACQQQIADSLNRSMVLPPYAADIDVNLTLPSPSAGKAIVWNSSGTNLENSTVSVNALEGTLNNYKTIAQNAANTATTKAGIAITKADEATVAANQLQGLRSNCITEIPQDIKLELSSGTLTLKAGSKVYVPNGSGVFNPVTISSDKTRTETSNGTFLLFLNRAETPWSGEPYLTSVLVSKSTSGTTDSLAGTTYHVWFDTTNNLIKRYGSDGNVVAGYCCLPLCIFTVSSGAISSIDQVFNGFGYIGSLIFALPGVEVLAPYGRNTDGTLKSYYHKKLYVTLRNNPGTSVIAINAVNGDFGVGSYKYDPVTNYNYSSGSISDRRCIIGQTVVDLSNKISSFTTKQAFHPIDYFEAANKFGNNTFVGTNDFTGSVTVPTVSSATDNSTKAASTAWVTNHLNNATVQATIVGWAMPKYSTLTSISITSGTEKSFTATKNCLVVVSASGSGTQCYIKSSGETISRTDVASQASSIVSATAFVKAGDTVKLFASGGTTTSAKWCELYN